jgi:hypothetical protein
MRRFVALPRLVLVHDGVENPVGPVFDTPVRNSDLAEPFRRQRSAEQVTNGLSCRCACGLSGANDLSFPEASTELVRIVAGIPSLERKNLPSKFC